MTTFNIEMSALSSKEQMPIMLGRVVLSKIHESYMYLNDKPVTIHYAFHRSGITYCLFSIEDMEDKNKNTFLLRKVHKTQQVKIMLYNASLLNGMMLMEEIQKGHIEDYEIKQMNTITHNVIKDEIKKIEWE